MTVGGDLTVNGHVEIEDHVSMSDSLHVDGLVRFNANEEHTIDGELSFQSLPGSQYRVATLFRAGRFGEYAAPDLNLATDDFVIGTAGARNLFAFRQDGQLMISGSGADAGKFTAYGDIVSQGSNYTLKLQNGQDLVGSNHIVAIANNSYIQLRSSTNHIYHDSHQGHIFRSGDGTKEYARVNGDGRIGIQTTSPQALFQIDSASSTIGWNDLSGSLGLFGSRNNGIGIDGNEIAKAGGDLYIGTLDNHDIEVRAGASATSRLFISASGRIGLNTTDPSTTFHVNGSQYIQNGALSIRKSDNSKDHVVLLSDGTQGRIRIHNGSNWGLIMKGVDNNPRIGAYHSGSIRIVGFKDSQGNEIGHTLTTFDLDNEAVGIGTTEPATKLHVQGSGVFSGSSNRTLEVSTTNADAKATIKLNTFRDSVGTMGSTNFFKSGSMTYLDSDEDFAIRPNGRTNARFHGGGDISFVSTSVDGVERTYMFIDKATRHVGIGEAFHFANAPDVRFQVSGSESNLVRIESDGSPNQNGAQLYIEGNKNDTLPSRTTIIELKGNSISRARGIEYTSTDVDYKKWYAGTTYGEDGYTIGYTNTDGAAEGPEYRASSSLFITHQRRVGIGTTTPSHDLTVAGDISASVNIHTPRLIVSTSNNNAGLVWQDPVTPGDYYSNRITLTSARNMQFRAGNVFQFANGSVQILDSHALHFNNDGNGGRIEIDNSGTGDESRLSIKTGSVELMTISGSGNVGIGTTTPAAKLEVSGDISSSGTVLANDIILTGDSSVIRTNQNNPEGTILINPEGLLGIASGSTNKTTIGRRDNTSYRTVFFDGTPTVAFEISHSAVHINVPVTASKDIELTEHGGGIVMQSPNGTRYRVTVANDGTLTTTAL